VEKESRREGFLAGLGELAEGRADLHGLGGIEAGLGVEGDQDGAEGFVIAGGMEAIEEGVDGEEMGIPEEGEIGLFSITF